jgi:hyperosmotically inducible periplasmic protein
MKSSFHSQKGRSLTGIIVSLLIILVVAAGVSYTVNARGGSVKAAWNSIKETSEDAGTTTKVKTALALSKHLSAFDINVNTKQGQVTLAGEVPSEEIKTMAGVIAQDTSGVKQLNNNLGIDPSVRPNPEASRLGERVADLEIKAIVQDAMAKSPELRDKHIEAGVKERSVTLSGTVETSAQKNLAQQIAGGIMDVHGVINNITVIPLQNAVDSPDERLSKRVEFELYSTKAFSLNGLQIHSQDGMVTLSGSVSSKAEKLLAEKVAQSVDGVRKIVNNLTVQEEGQRK